MQDPGCELPRTPFPRASVNKKRAGPQLIVVRVCDLEPKPSPQGETSISLPKERIMLWYPTPPGSSHASVRRHIFSRRRVNFGEHLF